MSPSFWPAVLTFSQTLADEVGQRLLADFGQVQAQEKSDGSLVTQADQWSDERIRGAIAQQFPDHGILSEETTHVFPNNDWCWVIDPLDGTTNFAQGIPLWGISLGLLYRGTPVFGYVAIPPLNEAFYGYWYQNSTLPLALQGPQGAYIRLGQAPQKSIQTYRDDLNANCLFSFCTRSISSLQQDSVRDVSFPCKIRMLGVATYNMLSVARGATLGGVEATPKVWDIAAVWAIAQAAGATWVSLTQPYGISEDKSAEGRSAEAAISNCANEPSPFPLIPYQNYRTVSYPTLVLATPQLFDRFQPFVQGIVQS